MRPLSKLPDYVASECYTIQKPLDYDASVLRSSSETPDFDASNVTPPHVP